MFKADGRPAYVGGNIGKPLLDYHTDGGKADYVVAELSSFQLDLTEKLTPACAVFTNLEEDHLDPFGSRGLVDFETEIGKDWHEQV